MAQNFAIGTTAEDIGSVFAPDADNAGLLRCRLLVAEPTVIAELVFDNQGSAEAVVKMYNGKKADNRVLYVYHSDTPSQAGPPAATGGGGLASRISAIPVSGDDSAMEVDDSRPRYQQPYTPPRAPRAQPEVQDGRFGFSDTNNAYRPRQHEERSDGGLVSDSLIGRQNGQGGRGGGGINRTWRK
jgi:hypothetical protein